MNEKFQIKSVSYIASKKYGTLYNTLTEKNEEKRCSDRLYVKVNSESTENYLINVTVQSTCLPGYYNV